MANGKNKVDKFIDESVKTLLDEDFNLAYWLTSLVIMYIGLVFMCIPATLPIGIALWCAPIITYGLMWAGVGITYLVNEGCKAVKNWYETHVSNPQTEDDGNTCIRFMRGARDGFENYMSNNNELGSHFQYQKLYEDGDENEIQDQVGDNSEIVMEKI